MCFDVFSRVVERSKVQIKAYCNFDNKFLPSSQSQRESDLKTTTPKHYQWQSLSCKHCSRLTNKKKCFTRLALTSSSQAVGNSLPGNLAIQAWQKSEKTPLWAVIFSSFRRLPFHDISFRKKSKTKRLFRTFPEDFFSANEQPKNFVI